MLACMPKLSVFEGLAWYHMICGLLGLLFYPTLCFCDSSLLLHVAAVLSFSQLHVTKPQFYSDSSLGHWMTLSFLIL